jgi:hypothetical protein
VGDSKKLRRVIVNNCNLAEKNFMNLFVEGFKINTSIDALDLQLNDLEDRHFESLISALRNQQLKKDGLRWRLGLRR